jgi:hypothetical protein
VERLKPISKYPVPDPEATMSNTRFPDCEWGVGPSKELTEKETFAVEFGLPLFAVLANVAFPLTKAEGRQKN